LVKIKKQKAELQNKKYIISSMKSSVLFRIKNISIIFIGVCLFAQDIQLYLFEDDGLYGYMDQHNHIVIDAQYLAAMEFTENGIAAVADSAGWAYIDVLGNILIRPYIYDNGPDYFSEGLARFVENGKFGFFDKFGVPVIDAQWDFAYPFHNGKAAVCNGCKIILDNEHSGITGGKWGYIDKTGKIISPVGSVEADSVLPKPAKIKLFKM